MVNMPLTNISIHRNPSFWFRPKPKRNRNSINPFATYSPNFSSEVTSISLEYLVLCGFSWPKTKAKLWFGCIRWLSSSDDTFSMCLNPVFKNQAKNERLDSSCHDYIVCWRVHGFVVMWISCLHVTLEEDALLLLMLMLPCPSSFSNAAAFSFLLSTA